MSFDSLYQRWLDTNPATTTQDEFIDTVFAWEGCYLDTGDIPTGDSLYMNLYTKDEFLFLLDKCEDLCPST